MRAQVRIIVSGVGSWRYVDCVAIRAGKLEALEYVRMLYGVPLDRCVAAGDSGNDILMLEGAPYTLSTCRAPCPAPVSIPPVWWSKNLTARCARVS